MPEVLCWPISSSWGGLRLLAETVINKFEYILASIVVKTYIYIFTKLNLMTFQGLSENIKFNSLGFFLLQGVSLRLTTYWYRTQDSLTIGILLTQCMVLKCVVYS